MDADIEARAEPLTIATEAVRGSDVPVRLMLCETIDGLYAPIGLRVPRGEGPFPLVLFASGNGGGGLEVVREFTQNRSGTQEEFLRRGYAVAWLRYRAEVDYAYDRIGRLVEDRRQNRGSSIAGRSNTRTSSTSPKPSSACRRSTRQDSSIWA